MTAAAVVTGERILVVDDEADIVALVAYHLVKAGYRVSTASTGPDALAAASQERPALIVLDLMLPGASGYDVLAKLRSTPATRDIAVLMLTARREEPDRIRGLALGADDYLTKPFSPQERERNARFVQHRYIRYYHRARRALRIRFVGGKASCQPLFRSRATKGHGAPLPRDIAASRPSTSARTRFGRSSRMCRPKARSRSSTR